MYTADVAFEVWQEEMAALWFAVVAREEEL